MVSDKELIEGMIRTVNNLKKSRNDETREVAYILSNVLLYINSLNSDVFQIKRRLGK